MIAAQLASQAQRFGRSIHLLNPLRQEHGVVGDPSGTTRKFLDIADQFRQG